MKKKHPKTREFREAENLIHPSYNSKNNMVYIANTVKADNIHIGKFTYYDNNGDQHADFETQNVFYNFPGHGELYIGSFCSLAYGVEIIMPAANHSMASLSSYPFNLITKQWAGKLGMTRADMPPIKNTVIGNDVWIGRKAVILPGVTIGDGAVIGASAVVSKDIPPYAVAVGEPAKVVKYRFDEETIAFMEKIQWWNWEEDLIQKAIPYLSTVHINEAKEHLSLLYEENLRKAQLESN